MIDFRYGLCAVVRVCGYGNGHFFYVAAGIEVVENEERRGSLVDNVGSFVAQLRFLGLAWIFSRLDATCDCQFSRTPHRYYSDRS